MSVMRVQIHRVSDWGVFIIEAFPSGHFLTRYVFRTFSPWMASVCERAKALDAAVEISYQERIAHGKPYRMIETVALVQPAAAAEVAQ